jgi:hypothetical protein
MTREKRSHALNSGKTYTAAASQVTSPGNATANALLTSFLRR